jgi:hypothetical protein
MCQVFFEPKIEAVSSAEIIENGGKVPIHMPRL